MEYLLTTDVRKKLAGLVMEMDSPEARHLARNAELGIDVEGLWDCPTQLLTEQQRLLKLIMNAFDELFYEIQCVVDNLSRSAGSTCYDLRDTIHDLLRLANSPEAACMVAEAIVNAEYLCGNKFTYDDAEEPYRHSVAEAVNLMGEINHELNIIKTDIAKRAKKEAGNGNS